MPGGGQYVPLMPLIPALGIPAQGEKEKDPVHASLACHPCENEVGRQAPFHRLLSSRARFSSIWLQTELGSWQVPTGPLYINPTGKPKPLFLFQWLDWHVLCLAALFYFILFFNFMLLLEHKLRLSLAAHVTSLPMR